MNDQVLAKPIRIRLANIAHPFDISTNTVCRFEGQEVIGIVINHPDPKTGLPLQQALPGRYFEFEVSEVINSPEVKLGKTKAEK